jgi:hypothetical protein
VLAHLGRRQPLELVREDDPLVRLVHKVVGHLVYLVARRFEVDGPHTYVPGHSAAQSFVQLLEDGFDAAAAVPYVIHNEKTALRPQTLREVAEVVHFDGRIGRVDVSVARRADGNVVDGVALVLEHLMDDAANGRTAAPQHDHVRRHEAAVQHSEREAHTVDAQPLGADKVLLDDGGHAEEEE